MSDQSRKTALLQVAQWFAVRNGETLFLPGDGRVLPLGRDEAAAIRSSVEAKAIGWHAGFELRAWIAVIAFVAVFMTMQTLSHKVPTQYEEGVRAAAYAIYSVHGLWILWEAIQVGRAMKTLRASIAHSLAGRVPLPAERAGALGRIDPVPAVLTALVLALFGWNWLAEVLAHRGLDLIGVIPAWLPIPLALFIAIVALGSRWLDRRNGIGVVPGDEAGGGGLRGER